MAQHVLDTHMSEKSLALVVYPIFEPSDYDDNDRDAVEAAKEAAHHDSNAFTCALHSAMSAWEMVGHARYNTDAKLIEVAEMAYALAVMNAIHMQAVVDGWSHPTQWTDGQVSEDGYIRIYNDGRAEMHNYQGEEVDEIRVVDRNGLSMRNPY